MLVPGDDNDDLESLLADIDGWDALPAPAAGIMWITGNAASEEDLEATRRQILKDLGIREPLIQFAQVGDRNLVSTGQAEKIYETWAKRHPRQVPVIISPGDTETGPGPDDDGGGDGPEKTPDDETGNDNADGEEKSTGKGSGAAKKKADTKPALDKGDNSQGTPVPNAGYATLTKLWSSLDSSERAALAKTYVEQLVASHGMHDRAQAYKTAAEVVLLDALDSDTDDADKAKVRELRLQTLRVRSGIPDPADQQIERAQTRVETQLLQEVVEGMKKWRALANWAPWFLLGTVVFSAAMAAFAMWATYKGKIDGLELAGIVFVLALFAISPVVLLLLERPLSGLDQWSPGGGGGGDGDGGGDGNKDNVKKPEDGATDEKAGAGPRAPRSDRGSASRRRNAT